MSDLKLIRNTSSIEQYAFVGQKQFVLKPDEEKRLTADLALEFIKQNPGTIIEINEVLPGAVLQDGEAAYAQLTWVANMTGNPDATPMIKVRDKTKNGVQMYEIPNPLAKPVTVKGDMDGGMKEYTDAQTGLWALNLGKIHAEVAPYTRREMPAYLAKWLLSRDANSRYISEAHTGKIMLSRKPSFFEPDMSWELDDMRCYLKMMDSGAILGPSESEVLKGVDADQLVRENALVDAKMLCMRRLHFRLANPQYRTFNKTEFTEFRRGFEKPVQKSVVTQPAQQSRV